MMEIATTAAVAIKGFFEATVSIFVKFASILLRPVLNMSASSSGASSVSLAGIEVPHGSTRRAHVFPMK
jgi:hypothetical protein